MESFNGFAYKTKPRASRAGLSATRLSDKNQLESMGDDGDDAHRIFGDEPSMP